MRDCAWKRFWGTYHANKHWPDPYVCPDREAVRAPFAIMVHNGWRLQNTLNENHFETGTAELSESGRIKVRWILTQAPVEYRTIFMQRSTEPELDLARTEAIQLTASKVVPDGKLVDVVAVDVRTDGWPAQYIDAIDRKFRDTTPAPRLPEATPAGESE